MIKIKIIECSDSQSLENEVNQFLRVEDIGVPNANATHELVDISYTTQPSVSMRQVMFTSYITYWLEDEGE